MRALSDAELLTLWEQGRSRHPIDRAMLLGAWARPDLSSDRITELPLGALNEALLRLRTACFGPPIDAYVDCERCGERLELVLDTATLLAGACEGDARTELEFAGFRFRVPCSRDLAAVAHDSDLEEAAQRLLTRCRIDRTDPALTEDPAALADMLDELEARLEALDPLADMRLALTCNECGHGWSAGFDIGALLWDEIEVLARAVFFEIHRLASAYGWTEPEILALTPARRAAYLELLEA